VVSVGAVGRTGGTHEAAFFSNTAPLLCAPGLAIPSARPGLLRQGQAENRRRAASAGTRVTSA
jgi:hypothetical protein